MTYGFKFFNNSSELVLDDSNIKPWYFTDTTPYSRGIIGNNWANNSLQSQWNFLNGGFAGITNFSSAFSSTETWIPYEIKYVAPNTTDCFAVFTLPSSDSNDIWYAPSENGSWAPLTSTSPYITSTGYGGYPNFSIYALVPQSWLATNPSNAQIAAVIPKVYFYSTLQIPSGSRGTGYGMQLFDQSGKCMYDSEKRHIQIKPYSDAQMYFPDAFYASGSTVNGEDTINIIWPQDINNTAWCFPSAGTNIYYKNTSLYGNVGYKYEFKAFWQSRPNSGLIRSKNIGVKWSTITDSYTLSTITDNQYTILNRGLENYNGTTLSTRALTIDSTGFDTGYTTQQFPASYRITVNATSVNEHQNFFDTDIVFTVYAYGGSNSNAILNYTLSGTGITGNDFSSIDDGNRYPPSAPVSTTGYVTLQDGVGTITIRPKDDKVLEGTETLTMRLDSYGTSASINITERKTYVLSWITTPTDGYKFNEGTQVTVRLTTENVPNNTQIPYSILPYPGYVAGQPDASDFTNNSTTGYFTVQTVGNNSTGTADATFTIKFDGITEGAERFYVVLPTIDSSYQNIFLMGEIQDASPTFSIMATGGTYTGDVNLSEGNTYTFLVYTNAPAGTTIYPIIANPLTADATDFSASWFNSNTGINSGVQVGAFGYAAVQFTVVADQKTEGTEYFTFAVDYPNLGTRAATYPGLIYIADTSKTPTTYAISPSILTVKEGSNVTWTITTTGVPDNTYLFWKNNGTTDASDFTDNINSDSIAIVNNTATITKTLIDDAPDSGESIIIALYASSISTTALATSSTVTTYEPSYSLTVNTSASAGGSTYINVNEGTTIYFWVDGTNAANSSINYTYAYWTGTNITQSDFTGSNINGGTVSLNSSGNAYITCAITNDLTTDGTKYFAFRVNDGYRYSNYVYVSINDTSLTPVYNESLSLSKSALAYNDTFNIYITNAMPGDGVSYCTDGVNYIYLTTVLSDGTLTFYNVGAGYAPGSYTLYIKFSSNGHIRTANWTVWPTNGTVLSSYCLSYGNAPYTYRQVIANGTGGSYNSDTNNSTNCGVPAAGTVLSSSCIYGYGNSPYTLRQVIADGSGGSYNSDTNNSPSCGYAPPAYGTVLNSYCVYGYGNAPYTYRQVIADGSGGSYNNDTNNSASCGYTPPATPPSGYLGVYGDSTYITVYWGTSNATSVSWSGYLSNTATSGSQTFDGTGGAFYGASFNLTMYIYGPGGSTSRSVYIPPITGFFYVTA